MPSFARHLALLLLLAATAAGQDADSLYRAALQSYTAGQYRAAEEQFGALCDSTTPQVVFYLAMSHCSRNDVREGIPLLARAVALDPGNAAFRFQYARVLAQSGSADAAAAEYARLVGDDPSFVAARYQLGLLRYESRAYADAAAQFRAVVDLNPADYLAYYYLASAYVGLGEPDSARRYLPPSLSLNAHYVPALALLASLQYADGAFAEAARLYGAAAALRPHDADLVYRIGLAYGKMGKIDSAFAYCALAAGRDTANDVYAAQAGYYALVTERCDAALSWYRRAVAIDPGNSLYFVNLALTFSRLALPDSAIDAYTRAIQACHPGDLATVHLRLGTLYFYQKDYRKALASYQRALDLQPLSGEAQYYVALAYDQLANPQAATRQYRKYLALVKDDTTAPERERKRTAGERLRTLRR